ncbi:hypothetical protein KUCAC02_027500, partial [Chaenocephalus aceratus]
GRKPLQKTRPQAGVGGSAPLRSIELMSNTRLSTSQFPLAERLAERRSRAPVNENHLVLKEVIRVGTTAEQPVARNTVRAYTICLDMTITRANYWLVGRVNPSNRCGPSTSRKPSWPNETPLHQSEQQHKGGAAGEHQSQDPLGQIRPRRTIIRSKSGSSDGRDSLRRIPLHMLSAQKDSGGVLSGSEQPLKYTGWLTP